MRPWICLALLSCFCILPAAVLAGFAGAWTYTQGGASLSLDIRQDASGVITGSLSGANGARFDVEGLIEGDVASGMCTGQGLGSYFEARESGGSMIFILVDLDAGGMPDMASARQLVFERKGAAPPPGPAQPGAGQAQAAPSANAPPSAAAGLLGCWQCQSAAGPTALIFHSENLLTYAGEQSSYQAGPGVIRVYNGMQTTDYAYAMQGGQMAVAFPDGSRIQCMRADCYNLVNAAPRQSGNAPGQAGSGNNNVSVPYSGGSWDTDADIQYHDDSAGYGGGAYDNPNSGYYENE